MKKNQIKLKNHWEDYYKTKKNNSVWQTFPSQFAIFTLSNVKEKNSLLEIGCGNGRDSLFFSNYFNNVLCVDYSSNAIDIINKKISKKNNIKANILDLYNDEKVDIFSKLYSKSFNIIYGRFFLHAINKSGEINFWKIANHVLKKEGKVFVEYRNNLDSRKKLGKILSDNERQDGHYRRFINNDNLLNRAKKFSNLKEEYFIHGIGFSKYFDEDPNVSRLILSKIT